MLRVSALCWLVGGACCAANAQTLYLGQNHADNYAVIAPGDISSNIELWQRGKTNTAITEQTGPDNSMEVNQRARSSNLSIINQFGTVNTAIVTQAYDFRNTFGSQNGYIGEQTNYGYLSQFNSGGVSILALTGPGNTLISTFGRGH